MGDRRGSLGPIGTRVALATLVVAVGALGVLATLTLVSALGDVSSPHSVGVSSTGVSRTRTSRRSSSITISPLPKLSRWELSSRMTPRRRMACTRSTSSRGLNGLVR